MRRCDWVRNLDTRLVCARKHRQFAMRYGFSNSVPWPRQLCCEPVHLRHFQREL